MAKKSGTKKPFQPKKWSMRPQLDAEVQGLLLETGVKCEFHPQVTYDGTVNTYDTNVMGSFSCRNPKCGVVGWKSKRIAISIREFRNNKYNARVYHQGCRQCGWISKPKLDASYAERIAYRIKFWHGISQARPVYVDKKTRRPHKAELCEGCKAGHCVELR